MADVTEGTAGGVEGAASKAVHDVRGNEELHELDGHEEHPGGGRFNRLLVFVVAGIAMIVGVVVVQGIRSAGVTTPSSATQERTPGRTRRATRPKSTTWPRARCDPGRRRW
jgi:hypothetical protein